MLKSCAQYSALLFSGVFFCFLAGKAENDSVHTEPMKAVSRHLFFTAFPHAVVRRTGCTLWVILHSSIKDFLLRGSVFIVCFCLCERRGSQLCKALHFGSPAPPKHTHIISLHCEVSEWSSSPSPFLTF